MKDLAKSKQCSATAGLQMRCAPMAQVRNGERGYLLFAEKTYLVCTTGSCV